jgi:hypothetical protein
MCIYAAREKVAECYVKENPQKLYVGVTSVRNDN